MKKIILAFATIATIASCSKENVETTDVWNGELRISSGITTRASGTSWDDGDEIGVFMSLTGSTTEVGTHNTPYSTTLSAASTTASFSVLSTIDAQFDPLYYPQSGQVDIVAHYPYDEDASLSIYPINVENQTSAKDIDFMSAKMVNVVKSSTELNLEFYHLLSQLNITLTPATDGGLTEGQLASATVTVSGTQVEAEAELSADYDNVNDKYIPTAKFTISGDATYLSLEASSSKASFILVPQTTDVTITITVSGVGVFTVEVDDMALESGNEYNYTISVSKTAAKIEGATIVGWGNGDEGNDGKDYGELDANDL